MRARQERLFNPILARAYFIVVVLYECLLFVLWGIGICDCYVQERKKRRKVQRISRTRKLNRNVHFRINICMTNLIG